jgi:hypothetical protein
MAGRRAILMALAVLALAGCDHLDALRQGVLSTYSQDLRMLAEDIDRKELAKYAAEEDSPKTATVHPTPTVQQVQWQAVPLTDSVRLLAPIPFEGSVSVTP